MSKQDISKILDKGHQGVGAKVADYDYVELEEALAKDKPFKVFLNM